MKQMSTAARSTTVNASAGSLGVACFNSAASMLMAHEKRPSTLKAKMLLRSAAAIMTLGLCAGAMTMSTPAYAGTILTVNTIADSGGSGTLGSLRYALDTIASNCSSGPLLNPFTINFNIPSAGPHTISPMEPLPDIACNNTIINGYSQPGATANTSGLNVFSATPPPGNNANIQIILDGTNAGSTRGLTITGNNVIVKGLAIRSFAQEGIFITGNDAIIQGNYIGTDPGGDDR